MSDSKTRVRFAPAPTGAMHLGNIRTALFNFLFEKQKKGTLVLRIEDTDPKRNFDPQGTHIIQDLNWLGIEYDEGPNKLSQHGPYFQSKRTQLYKQKLQELIEKETVYRCFCTQDELEKKRQRQKALKQPPRYDRTCLKLPQEKIDKKLEAKIPFVWRVKLDHSQHITINDLGHGKIEYDLKNFSDFPVTRQDGSFTFMLANCIDDIDMNITHVFRGEDHQTNTVGQAFLYYVFNMPLPIYWHMPIMCNIDGKKLSKRDFGFSLKDLKSGGFLPEAIVNYLSIIGGSFEKEIMPVEKIVQSYNFEHVGAPGHIKYDVDKLRWVNHKWLTHYDTQQLTKLVLPILEKKFPAIKNEQAETIENLIKMVQPELVTLNDISSLAKFYFEPPKDVFKKLEKNFSKDLISSFSDIKKIILENLENSNQTIEKLKSYSKDNNIKIGDMFKIVRMALIGKSNGPGLADILNILGTSKTEQRIKAI